MKDEKLGVIGRLGWVLYYISASAGVLLGGGSILMYVVLAFQGRLADDASIGVIALLILGAALYGAGRAARYILAGR